MSLSTTIKQKLTITTFNIRVGVDTHLTQVAQDCCLLNTDILCLQEIGRGWQMGVAIDQSAYLAAAQQHAHYMFAPALTDTMGGNFGIAVTSKYSLHNSQFYKLPCIEDEQRVCFSFQIMDAIHQQSITVFTTHLSIKQPERLLQAQFIAHLVKQTHTPVLLVGDLNDLEDSPVLQCLYQTGLQDAWSTLKPMATSEEGYTFSTAHPNRRIDYLLYKGLVCHSIVKRTDLMSSDHFPVSASFSM